MKQKLDLVNEPLETKDRIATTRDEGIISRLQTIVEESEDNNIVPIRKDKCI